MLYFLQMEKKVIFIKKKKKSMAEEFCTVVYIIYIIVLAVVYVAALTYRGPGRCLPNIIQLPVEGTHGVPFTLNNVTLTATVKFSLCFYTLGLHDLHRPHIMLFCVPHILALCNTNCISSFSEMQYVCEMQYLFCHLCDIYSVSVSLSEVCVVGKDVM